MDKNLEYVKEIADNLEKVASGDYFMYDGELFPIDTDDFSEVKGCRYDEEDDMYIMPDGEELCERDVYPVDILESVLVQIPRYGLWVHQFGILHTGFLSFSPCIHNSSAELSPSAYF